MKVFPDQVGWYSYDKDAGCGAKEMYSGLKGEKRVKGAGLAIVLHHCGQ